MGYFKDAVKGVSWVGALRISTRLVAVLKIFILGRILVPEQFGLIGIATLVLSLVEIFTETGINVFLLQEKKEIDKYINTAWVTSIGRGFLICALILISTLFIPSFFRSIESASLLILISLVPLIKGFINPAIIKLQKNLLFNQDFAFRFVLFTVDASVAIILGIITKNPTSLVYGLIVGAILEVFLSFYFMKPTPKFVIEKAKIQEIISRGKWIAGAGIFEYFFREGDDIVVGRLLGASPLGLYQMAYKIATLPITEVADVFGKVTLPVFVRIGSDKNRLKIALIKTTLSVTAIVLPFGILLIVFSEQIITFLLGNQWVGAASALQFVAIYAVLRAIINPPLTLFLAMKRQKVVTLVTFISIFGMAVTIIPLVLKFGITGAGISTIIGVAVSLPVVAYYSREMFR